MTRDEIAQEVIAVLSEQADLDPAEVTEDKSLIVDLEIDSLLIVEVLVALETHFQVTLPKKELFEEFQLVSDLVTHIEKRLTA